MVEARSLMPYKKGLHSTAKVYVCPWECIWLSLLCHGNKALKMNTFQKDMYAELQVPPKFMKLTRAKDFEGPRGCRTQQDSP